jgi:hypothetical protein
MKQRIGWVVILDLFQDTVCLKTPLGLIDERLLNFNDTPWVIKVGTSCLYLAHESIPVDRFQSIQEIDSKNEKDVLQVDIVAS